MSKYQKRWFKPSEYPSNFIPSGATTFVGFDKSEEGDCTVKGFYKDGIYHIQEVDHNKSKR